MKRLTPNNISNLKNNEIFVFGSNRQGRHGKGAALIAMKKFWAIYGQSEGLMGNSYGIITKELRKDYLPVTLQEIKDGVDKFIEFSKINKDLIFYVTEIGCHLAGFNVDEIAPLFRKALKLENVYLPERFLLHLQKGFTL